MQSAAMRRGGFDTTYRSVSGDYAESWANSWWGSRKFSRSGARAYRKLRSYARTRKVLQRGLVFNSRAFYFQS